jgi:hypothetical protein
MGKRKHEVYVWRVKHPDAPWEFLAGTSQAVCEQYREKYSLGDTKKVRVSRTRCTSCYCSRYATEFVRYANTNRIALCSDHAQLARLSVAERLLLLEGRMDRVEESCEV